MKILIIGGGIFGCSAAIELAKNKEYKITLAELEGDIMQNASLCNHNRLHLGYHYLRSADTAEQSVEGLLSFMFNYGNAAITQFPNYYAIAREGSKTSPEEFLNFCDNVGIGYDEEFPDEYLMDRENVSACFRVPEPIFDYDILKEIIQERLQHPSINLRLKTKVSNVKRLQNGYEALLNDRKEEYDIVVNIAYNNINVINQSLGLKQSPLLFEEVIIPFFLYPSDKFGLTIMDGKFCSVMPKGYNKNEFLLYHVVHSVIQRAFDVQNKMTFTPKEELKSYVDRLYEESTAWYPFLESARHFGYWHTMRTVHENKNDARVTELFAYDELDDYYVILSGKISTCMQVALQLRHWIEKKTTNQKFKI